MSFHSRERLHRAAQSLCDDFASKKRITALLSHFSTTVEPEAIEHGEPVLAPFLGRKFSGMRGIQSYFELIAQHLSYDNMCFSDYVVDTVVKKVAVKGQAEFTWIRTKESWEESFVYVLEFDDETKVKRYEVWADSGSAYLARIGDLDNERRGADT